MGRWRVDSATLHGGEVTKEWQANHVYTIGARCVVVWATATAVKVLLVFEATTGGTSGAAQPSWDTTVGNTTADGPDTLVWTTRKADDGAWDNATCFLSYLLYYDGNIAAGDDVFVHFETSMINPAAAYYLYGSNDQASPIRIYSVDRADDSLRGGALISWNDYSSIRFYGNAVSVGVCFKQATYAGFSFTSSGNGTYWVLYGLGTDVLWLAHNNADYIWIAGVGYPIYPLMLKIIDGGIRFAKIGQRIRNDGYFVWKKGTLTAAEGTTFLFNAGGDNDAGTYVIADVDLSQAGAGATATSLFDLSENHIHNALFTRCKLPSAAGFVKYTGTLTKYLGSLVRFHHCSSGNDTYSFHEKSMAGTTDHELTVIRTGGANDGTTGLAWKLISSAKVKDNTHFAMESPPINTWTESTTEKTFTVEGVYDGATNLENDEVWMEFEYPANGTDGLGARASTKSPHLTTPTDLTVSTQTWGDGALANPNKFKFAVTVTPGKKGPITARIYLAKASTTIYIDPLITEI
jgi:hypothetical protein